jgi:hypothetical protein
MEKGNLRIKTALGEVYNVIKESYDFNSEQHRNV